MLSQGSYGRPMGQGLLADDQAQQLQEMIQQRRQPAARALSSVTATAAPRYFIQRRQTSDRRTGGLRSCAGASMRRPGHCRRRLAAGFTTGELAVLKVISRRMAGAWRLRSQPQRIGGEGRGLPFAGQAGGQACRTGWPVHGTAPATLGEEAPHQHHPHYQRRMARLAAPRDGARPMRSTPATGPSRSSRKLEGYKRTRHGHSVSEKLAASVWIRPGRRGIGPALVAPDSNFRKNAASRRLGNQSGGAGRGGRTAAFFARLSDRRPARITRQRPALRVRDRRHCTVTPPRGMPSSFSQ